MDKNLSSARRSGRLALHEAPRKCATGAGSSLSIPSSKSDLAARAVLWSSSAALGILAENSHKQDSALAFVDQVPESKWGSTHCNVWVQHV